MKKLLLTILLALVCTFTIGGRASALGSFDVNQLVAPGPAVQQEEPKPEPKPEVKKVVKKKPVIKKYTVKRGDNLIKIAKRYKTTWQRLYYKNKNIKNPDLIEPGVKLIIPRKNEKLKKRPLNVPVLATQSASKHAPGPTAGNTYTYGYCTWWVKERLPWVPNGWHNASTWGYYARQQGFYVGPKPKVGAVAWSAGNHVAVVTGIGKGTVTVSEMNYRGWNKVNSRTMPVGYWTGYIY